MLRALTTLSLAPAPACPKPPAPTLFLAGVRAKTTTTAATTPSLGFSRVEPTSVALTTPFLDGTRAWPTPPTATRFLALVLAGKTPSAPTTRSLAQAPAKATSAAAKTPSLAGNQAQTTTKATTTPFFAPNPGLLTRTAAKKTIHAP